jgi:lipopolysaccharide export system protein LptA
MVGDVVVEVGSRRLKAQGVKVVRDQGDRERHRHRSGDATCQRLA